MEVQKFHGKNQHLDIDLDIDLLKSVTLNV